MARVAWLFALLATWLISVDTVSSQEQPVRIISSIRFTGLEKTSETVARELAGITVGTPFETSALDQAVARLLRSGRFLSAKYNSTDEANGVWVTFDVREPTLVKTIAFEGNDRFGDGKLKGNVSQKIDSPIDWFAIRNGRDAIMVLYREAGFGDIKVTYDADRVSRTGELVYTIHEGHHVRIKEIVFEGNDGFDQKTLKRHIETKNAFWIIREGAFDEERAKADTARLQRFYRDEGFLDAQVGYRRDLDENGEDLTVVFTINEGTRYVIESIDLLGNTVFTDASLFASMDSTVGQTVRRIQITNDVRAIQDRYGELGYIYARVHPTRVFSTTSGFVRLTIDIDEGGQFRVGRVVVRGNTRTKDKVVRRALNLYPPDDLFDITEVREAQNRLRETRIFDSARVYPVGDQPGVRDVVIDVKEAQKAGDFLFGAGITSNAGLVGNIVLDLRNFDWSDRPRDRNELMKFRSFFGGGQHLRIELQPGTDLSRFRIDFTEPYWRDEPIRLDVSAYLFQRARENYDERRGGFTISVGKRFDRGRLRGWSGEIALRAEQVSLRDLEFRVAREIRDHEGSEFQTSVKVALVRDRTDNRFVPSKGDRWRLAYEQFGVLGGENVFGRISAGYTWYKTMRTDLQDRKYVLSLRSEVGGLIGNAPVYEKFYAGGTGSIRGFQFRGVGPRSGRLDDNIGGDWMLLSGAEYSFPLFGQNVRGFYFLDTGMVGNSDFRATIGVGGRFTLNIFGPVPLELGLGFPIVSQSGDETQVFSFLIGRIF